MSILGLLIQCIEHQLIPIPSDAALLQKYGLKDNDAILAEEKHMGLYDELLKLDAKLIAGGAAQNTARGAQVIYGCPNFRMMRTTDADS